MASSAALGFILVEDLVQEAFGVLVLGVLEEVTVFEDLEVSEELVNPSKRYDAHRAPKIRSAQCRIA
jgi:hypothetical protein